MIRFSPHLEILPEVQRWIYPRLQNLKKLGFVLYEGTALALQLGHRQSVDFDFFLHDPLDPVSYTHLTLPTILLV